MYFTTSVNDRPYDAIKNGKKIIEGRTISSWDPIDYRLVKINDVIEFTNSRAVSSLKVRVLAITHYPSIKEMLNTEEIECLLSSGGTIDDGIVNYNNIPEYQENVPKFGIYAIRFELIKEKNVQN